MTDHQPADPRRPSRPEGGSAFRPGRRALLGWTGVGAFVALSGGFAASARADSLDGRNSLPARDSVDLARGDVGGVGAEAGSGWAFDPELGLFAQTPNSTGVAVAWNFDGTGTSDVEGWQAAHSVAPLTVVDGALHVEVTGNDPYIVAPAIHADGKVARLLHLRARCTGAQNLKVYYATAQAPEPAEDKAFSVALPTDGEYHELLLDVGAANEPWRTGTVTFFRIDIEPAASPDGVLDLDFVRLENLGARLTATIPSTNAGSVRPGESTTLTSMIGNIGGVASNPFQGRLSVPDALALGGGGSGPSPTVPAIEPGATATLTWTLSPKRAEPAAVTLDLDAPGGATRFGTVVAGVPAAHLSGRATPRGVEVFRTPDGHICLQNKAVRLALLRGSNGFVQADVAIPTQDGWRSMATSQPLTWLAIDGTNGPELLTLAPDQVRLTPGNPARVDLQGHATAADGTTWRIDLAFSLEPDSPTVQAIYRATPSGDSALLAFRGPSLTAGEGSFGGAKSAALFPGLEWLVDDERSSNTLDALPPYNLRTTPHPLKVTVPLMAVLQDHALVSLQWDTNQAWDGTRKHPTARFASPNWLEGQRNHALTLFVPDVPTSVAENAPWATTPYPARGNAALEIRAEFCVAVTDDITTAIDLWTASHGRPDPATRPRTWPEQIELVRHAYAVSYWDPDVEGWPHVYGWEPSRFSGMAAMLQIAGLLSTGEAERTQAFERVRTFVANALAKDGPRALGNLDGLHIPMFHTPFYLGQLEATLPSYRATVTATLAGQKPDGSWRFDPGDDPARQKLGKPGAEAIGLTAVPAHQLLRYARLTGDATALAAGLKALSYMEKFTVPRAAQTWEVPVHTPDILASAYGVGAYTEGFRLTGDEKYLRLAEYWARTGLPFLYAWTDPERPLLEYASIPVFGASGFTYPWWATPVQWNGVVYAYHLLELDEVAGDRVTSLPLRRIAEGVVNSGLIQERTIEPGKGGYPDNWPLIANHPIVGVDINPEGLSKPAFVLMGRKMDVQTILMRRGSATVRLNTAAEVLSWSCNATRLTASLRFYDGASSQAMVIGLPAPQRVLLDGRELTPVPSLDAAGVVEGYRRLDDGTLLLALRHRERSELVIEVSS